MSEINPTDFENTDGLLDEEDEATLAAIDRGLKDVEEGRVVSATEARLRLSTGMRSNDLTN